MRGRGRDNPGFTLQDMITLKTSADLVHLRRAGRLLARTLDAVVAQVKPGASTADLDALAERLIRQGGARPAFKGYRARPSDTPFPTTLCTSVNDEVVHTPAIGRQLREGDIVGVDIGLALPADGREYFVDMAQTVAVGTISADARQLIAVTRRALEVGIAAVQPGRTVRDLGAAIQAHVAPYGYGIVRRLVGHGVGFDVHEPPRVPNFVDRHEPEVVLQPGLVIAIEPMVNLGGSEIVTRTDGWTIVTKDGSLSAHFEHTVAVTATGHEVLTLP